MTDNMAIMMSIANSLERIADALERAHPADETLPTFDQALRNFMDSERENPTNLSDEPECKGYELCSDDSCHECDIPF